MMHTLLTIAATSLATVASASPSCCGPTRQAALSPVAVSTVEPPVAGTPEATQAELSVDALLGILHRRGIDLADFDADVKLTDTDAATGDESSRAGRVLYHKAGQGAARLRVTFETRDEGTGPKPDRIEYLLDDVWLTDRNYRKRIEVRRQVLRPGQKINLLKLGEGPFPLPIGQEPAEVKRQFEVSPLEADDGTPKLRLVPRAGTQMARKFHQIDVWVDTATGFPARIETTDANQTIVRTTALTNLRVNPQPGLKDADFALSPLGADWKLTEEPYAE